jgi:ribulose-phosphate 3-epimerase
MDGRFVPPITIGPLVVEGVRKSTPIPLDVHLMIERPDLQIDPFVKAGADRITVHVEACADPGAVLAAIRAAGARPGLSLKPKTDLSAVRPFLHLTDLLLVMSVEPGWGGQAFIEASIGRIEELCRLRAETGTAFLIEVDGGIHADTGARVVRAGADVLVAGTAVFKQPDYASALAALRAPASHPAQPAP